MIADSAEEAAAEIKERAQRVVQEMKDVGAAVKEVGNQIGDIPSAVTGKTRVGRKPKK
jgi:methyl-accepting chemotaxis protein